jgi:hypothetical protein
MYLLSIIISIYISFLYLSIYLSFFKLMYNIYLSYIFIVSIYLLFLSIISIYHIFLLYLSIISIYLSFHLYKELQDIRTMHEAKPVIKGTYILASFTSNTPSNMTFYLKQLNYLYIFLIAIFSTINIIVYIINVHHQYHHHLYKINSHIILLIFTQKRFQYITLLFITGSKYAANSWIHLYEYGMYHKYCRILS